MSDPFDYPKTNAERAERWEDFDASRLDHAVDAVRAIVAALGGNIHPSSDLQEDLERLSEMVTDEQENAEYPDINIDVLDLADTIESRLYEIKEAADTILDAVSPLGYLWPDEEEEDEDDEYEEEDE